MPEPRDIAREVELVVFDFDGVLTDNTVYVLEDGREAVRCTRADGLAFDMFRAAAIKTAILSTECNPVVAVRAAKLKVPAIQAVVDKASAIAALVAEYGCSLQRTMFVGNDLNDLPALNLVGWPVAVGDSHPTVLRVARVVLRTRGGLGVAREIAEDLFGLGIDQPD